VLVLLILLPLFAGILQLGFALYVRNTLAACAQAGAREAASENIVAQDQQTGQSQQDGATPPDDKNSPDGEGHGVITATAVDRTRACIDDWVSSGFSADITVSVADDVGGVRVDNVVRVDVTSGAPVFALVSLGSGALHVTGEAMQELP